MFGLVLHALLCLTPVLALTLPLLARRYPGEHVLLARGAERPVRRWTSIAPELACRGVVLPAVCGGRLIGHSLAVRPPPAVLAAG